MKRIAISWSIVAAVALLPGAAAADVTSTDKKNASQQCRELRTGMGTAAFNQLFGTNASDKNAFGKCVSKKAKEEAAERKAARANAAKDCKAEQEDPNFAASHDGKTFDQFYGTNEEGKNAYGKCVSQKAKANKEAADAKDEETDEVTINSARECRTEQKADPDAFREKYGTGERKRNAFGKCVSQKSRAKQES